MSLKKNQNEVIREQQNDKRKEINIMFIILKIAFLWVYSAAKHSSLP